MLKKIYNKIKYRNVITELGNGAMLICKYGKNETATFKTFPEGKRILAEIDGTKRVITFADGQVVVNEGGKLTVLSNDQFIRTYEPVTRPGEHWRGGLEASSNAYKKSGTKSYIEICDEVIAKKTKELAQKLEQKGIKIVEYKSAEDICTYDAIPGFVKLNINGKLYESRHGIEGNELRMLKILYKALVEDEKFASITVNSSLREQNIKSLATDIQKAYQQTLK